MTTAAISLSDRYELEAGRVLATGVQAAARAILDQHRADRRAGLNTATLVSGYQGSPLAAFDVELARNRELFDRHDVVHVPGLNEELGATAVWGSQLADRLPDPRFDGVLGVWYAKAPGLDRAGDAIRHGNWVGAGSRGGVLALVGDDPSSKSSTLPSASEASLADLGIPTLYPGSPQEVLDYALHGFALSRACGLWTALKLVTDVADGFATVEVGPDRVQPHELPPGDPPFEHRPHANLLAPATLDLERSLVEVRLPRAGAYAPLNGLNEAVTASSDDWLGIIASGKSFHDVRQALDDLSLADRDLERLGIRLIRLGMIFPLDRESIRALCGGLDEVLVVEEKRPFIETQIRDALYGGVAPRVVGKRDENGLPLIPASGEVGPLAAAAALVARISQRGGGQELEQALARIRAHAELKSPAPELARTPFFCSGCPHNRATEAPEGSAVGIGIGCHTMVLLNPEGRGELAGVTQMGGEGAHWVGVAPFTGLEHFIQNIGDGTFHHSGSLALRFAVAAGANVTFKLLYNRAVAMTGGQHVEGQMEVPELTRMLEAEGVRRTIVTTDDPKAYRRVKLARNAEVRDRAQLIDAQRELAAERGVTVLIHDQGCAAELRRLRKRGKAPEPELRVAINERVCEGCGDCGEKSSCLSVQPVETEFGRKTRIHQPSCNKDYSCLEGDCPSFVTITGAAKLTRRDPGLPHAPLPEPERRTDWDEVRVRLLGIGGTGVVTVNQILGMAAMIDGLHASGLDQTGLAQKGGPVISDLCFRKEPLAGSARARPGGVDALLVFDLLTGTVPSNLAVADPERTLAAVSTSAVATGQMVTDKDLAFPALDSLLSRVESACRGVTSLDSEGLAMSLFGDSMPANMVTLGAAFQQGAIPLSAASIEEAIRLNRAGVESNLKAFAWGRACVTNPDLIEQVTRDAAPAVADVREPTEAEWELIDATGAKGELRRLLGIRVPELAAYQSLSYAEEYARFVAVVAEVEAEVSDERPVTEAVARNLFKLMAYKDEYEVARLHLLETERIRASFGDDAKVKWNLQPPFMRALGLKRKIHVGSWFTIVFRPLRAMRRLRGGPLDVFGLAKVRRTERALIQEYRTAIEKALTFLAPASQDAIAEIAELPDMIRGYEQIKLEAAAAYRAELAQRMSALEMTEPVRV